MTAEFYLTTVNRIFKKREIAKNIFEILKKIPDNLKFSYLHENAGHYGIFSGKAWREDIRPEFINFINKF